MGRKILVTEVIAPPLLLETNVFYVKVMAEEVEVVVVVEEEEEGEQPVLQVR